MFHVLNDQNVLTADSLPITEKYVFFLNFKQKLLMQTISYTPEIKVETLSHKEDDQADSTSLWKIYRARVKCIY